MTEDESTLPEIAAKLGQASADLREQLSNSPTDPTQQSKQERQLTSQGQKISPEAVPTLSISSEQPKRANSTSQPQAISRSGKGGVTLDAFISYSHHDQLFARQLGDALAQRGYTTWFDKNDVFPAGEFREDIKAGIEEAGAFIFVLSPDSLISEECGKELKYAQECGKKLIPLLHRSIDPSHAPEALRDLDWIEDVSFDRLLEKLLNALLIDKEDWNHAGRWLRLGNEWEKDQKQNSGLLLHGKELKKAEDWLKRAEHWRLEGSNKGPQPQPSHIKFVRESRRAANHFFLASVIAIFLLISFTGGGAFLLLRPPDPTLVTTLNDSGQGSLRWCIANASSGSTISFAQNMTGTIKLTGGDLVFSGDKTLTISGPGANQLAVSGTNIGAIIHVSKGATITISGLSFKNSITNTNAFLLNEGTLTLTNSIISNNKTNALSTGAFGGGIENKGSLTVIDSTISNNTSIGPFNYGGGIYNAGQLIVNHSNISNNVIEGDISGGGGIWNYSTGTVTVTNHSIISNNVIRSGDATGTHGSEGGGMFNAGKLTVTNSTFSNNQVISSSGVSFGGGIINVDTGTITVSSSIFSENTATSTTNNSLGGGIDNVGKLTVTNSAFSNNQATSSSGGSAGGGIFNFNKGTVMVNSSTFSENTTKSVTKNSQGGGIENEGKLTVTNSMFSNNQTLTSTGNAFSGGINNFTSGTLVVTGSTFSKNIAKSDQHISQGGGIANVGKLTITNSTFSNNQAITSSGGSAGGGIFSISRDLEASFAIIRFCTIYENSSNVGGGIAIDPTGKSHMTISSNIIAHNSANEGPDIFGTVISEGYNLIENVNGAKELNAKTDRQVNLADLKIEPTLGNHGGPTQTLALLQGSQAIDAVPLQACSTTITDPWGHKVTITTDQRGHPRPDGSENACDVGAYESS